MRLDKLQTTMYDSLTDRQKVALDEFFTKTLNGEDARWPLERARLYHQGSTVDVQPGFWQASGDAIYVGNYDRDNRYDYRTGYMRQHEIVMVIGILMKLTGFNGNERLAALWADAAVKATIGVLDTAKRSFVSTTHGVPVREIAISETSLAAKINGVWVDESGAVVDVTQPGWIPQAI